MTQVTELKGFYNKVNLDRAEEAELKEVVELFKVGCISAKDYMRKLLTGTANEEQTRYTNDVEILKSLTNMDELEIWLSEYSEVEVQEIENVNDFISISNGLVLIYQHFAGQGNEFEKETVEVFDENYPFKLSYDDFLCNVEEPEED